MRITRFIYLIGLSVILSNQIFSQTDSLTNAKAQSFMLYYNSGFGIGTRGGTFGLGFTFISLNNLGGSISYKLNILKNKNVPEDYNDDGMRIFAPRDYLSLITLSLVKEFPVSNKSMRFGIEAGPAWVKYNVAQFEHNPSYDPNNAPWFGNIYKYYKSHTARKTIGLTLRGKAEFLPARYSGFELTVFTNLNSVQSVVGIEFYVSLGKVRN
jgi:hypothetical protein